MDAEAVAALAAPAPTPPALRNDREGLETRSHSSDCY